MKDKIDLEFMKWGFIPFWAKDEKIGYKLINARSEEIETKPSFKRSIITKRCLIPATGFYEWKKNGKIKSPYYFRLKDREIFSFAGIFDEWKNEKNEIIKTFTILTTEANSLVSDVHERMPVILSQEDEDKWLDKKLVDMDEIRKMLKPYSANKMEGYQVSLAVNSPSVNNKELIERLNSD